MMPKVQITSQIELDFDELLAGVAQLETHELEQFTHQVLSLRAHRRASALSSDETTLLQQINENVPPSVRERFQFLNTKLHDDTISAAEHTELLELVEQIELADAQRLQYLIALAELRGVSLEMLMTQLGLQPTYG